MTDTRYMKNDYSEEKMYNECKEIWPIAGTQHCKPSMTLEFKF
jgi:hypothetical protein